MPATPKRCLREIEPWLVRHADYNDLGAPTRESTEAIWKLQLRLPNMGIVPQEDNELPFSFFVAANNARSRKTARALAGDNFRVVLSDRYAELSEKPESFDSVDLAIGEVLVEACNELHVSPVDVHAALLVGSAPLIAKARAAQLQSMQVDFVQAEAYWPGTITQ